MLAIRAHYHEQFGSWCVRMVCLSAAVIAGRSVTARGAGSSDGVRRGLEKAAWQHAADDPVRNINNLVNPELAHYA